jgi:hypothetical protein
MAPYAYLRYLFGNLSAEDLRDYQLYMANQRVSSGAINSAISGFKFFSGTTLDRVDPGNVRLRYALP